MKKRDIIQLVKEIVKENTFYGNREQPSQLSTGTKVSVPTDEYPFSRKPKRTATGMMEDKKPNLSSIADIDRSTWNGEEGGSIEYMEYEDGTEMTPQEIQDYFEVNHELYDDIMNKVLDPKDLKEFKTPKSFDPDTLALVREMLFAADVYHNDLVGGYDEVSSYLDKRTGGTIIKFPHFNGPEGRGAMFGKETSDQIDRSKAKAKAAALKTYTKFKTYIEDYEISDKSPAGVYGNAYLWIMFNDLAKDYSAPKGGTQSSQFEEIDEEEVHGKEIVITAGSLQNALTFIGKNLKNLSSSMLSRLLGIFDVKDLKTLIDTFPHNVKDLKPKLKRMTPEEAKNFGLELNKFHTDMKRKNIKEVGAAKLYTVTSTDGTQTQMPFPSDTEAKATEKYSNINSVVPLEEEPSEGNAFGLAMQKAKEAGEDSFELNGKTFNVNEVEMEMGAEPEMTNDMGKDKWVDDEGRHAKMQLQKAAEYSVKLAQMMDDMTQLPSWVQSKITKASDYMSAVYHYLDYEMSSSNDNLMENVDKHRKRVTLMESATEKLFKLFNAGKTDEDVRNHYLSMNVDMPESFVSKLRKNWEDLRKTKLDLKIADQEAAGFKSLSTSPTTGMEGGEEGMEEIEDKTLATGLFADQE